MADHEKQKNRLSERHQIMELLWRKKTDVEEKTCQHQCREWQRPCWNPNKWQRKPWKPGFPPPYPHTLPRPVIGTLHVSSANSNTSSVFTPMCHSWTGTGIRTGRCMCPPPGGKAGCTGSHQGRERSGTMTWPCALCTVCTPPESPFLESVQTSCLFFAAMHCNAWPALVRFPN